MAVRSDESGRTRCALFRNEKGRCFGISLFLHFFEGGYVSLNTSAPKM